MYFSSTVLDAATLIASGASVRSQKELPQSVVRGMLGAWKALYMEKSVPRRVAALLLAGITDLKTHHQEPGVIRFTVPKLTRSVAQVIENATGKPARGVSERSMARHLHALRAAGFLEQTTLSFTSRGDAYSVSRWAGGVLIDWFKIKTMTSQNNDLFDTPLPNLADISEVPPKTLEAEERSAPTAPAPVDNQDKPLKKPVSPGRELHTIANETGMSKGQLGVVLSLCKAQKCKLQDVYGAVGGYLHALQLQGGRAFMYLQSCLVQNPGRDWTWEARRDAEQSAEQASERNANQAFERFMGKIRGGETVPVRSPQTGEPLILKQRAEAPEFVVILGSQSQFKGSLPVRKAFETFQELSCA